MHCLRTNTASETAMASSIASLRCELRLSRAAFAAAPPSASAVWATSVVLAVGSNPSGVPLPYVRATRARALIHDNAPFKPGAQVRVEMEFVSTHHRTQPAFPCPRRVNSPHDSHVFALQRCAVGQRQRHNLFGGTRSAVFDMRGSGALRPGMVGLPRGAGRSAGSSVRPPRTRFDPGAAAAKTARRKRKVICDQS